jgi:DNA polymerase-3 subunit gamma/tau
LIEDRLRQVIAASGIKAEDEAVQLIARSAEGGMRDALSLLDTCMTDDLLTAHRVREALGASGREAMYEFAGALILNDAGQALTLIGKAMDAGRDPQVFAREVTGHLRALLLAQAVKEGLEDLIESTREEAMRLQQQASGADSDALTLWMELFMRAEGDMKWMAQPRSALELAAVRCCRPEREQGAEALMERLSKLEAKLSNLSNLPYEYPLGADGNPPAPPPKTERAPSAPPAIPAPPKPDKAPKGAEPAGADKYRAAMEAIAKEQPQIYGMLKDAAFRGLDGDSVLMELPRARAFYRQILEKDEKKALIDQALATVFGRPMSFRFAQGGEAPKADPRTLEQAYDVFGRDKVSVLDE